MKWTAHVKGGPLRVNHAAALVNDKIYSIGGYFSSEDYNDWESISVHVLDTFTLRWRRIEYEKNYAVPFQIYGHTAVSYGHKIYVWGGRNNALASEKLYCFDTRCDKWSIEDVSGREPEPKDGHTSCIFNKKMYVFGGFGYFNEEYSDDVHYLDLETMTWSSLSTTGPCPSGRDFHTALIDDGKMIVYGGRSNTHPNFLDGEDIYCPEIYCLDLKEAKWTVMNPTGPKPDGRRSHSAWLHNDFMYIFGGFNENKKKHYKDIHRYSLKGNFWEPVNVLGKGPGETRRQVCLQYNNKVYLFGGTCPQPQLGSKMIDSSDLYLLDYDPSLKTLCIGVVLENYLDYSILPSEVRFEIDMMRIPNRITKIRRENS